MHDVLHILQDALQHIMHDRTALSVTSTKEVFCHRSDSSSSETKALQSKANRERGEKYEA